jgi:hypothetical protein
MAAIEEAWPTMETTNNAFKFHRPSSKDIFIGKSLYIVPADGIDEKCIIKNGIDVYVCPDLILNCACPPPFEILIRTSESYLRTAGMT